MYKVDGLCQPVGFVVLGPLANNVYFVGDETSGSLIVVDPSCDVDTILAALEGRKPDAIVITHAHWDHVGAAAALRAATGAPVIASAVDAPVVAGEAPSYGHAFEPCPVDRVVEDGDVLQFGSATWKVIATPGHTPGSMCLFADAAQTPEPDAMSILIAGDTLFYGTIGRTDFPEGSMDDMRESLKKLSALPDYTAVLTGHNDLTMIASERHRVFDYYIR